METPELRVRFQEQICWLQIDRPHADNSISAGLIASFDRALLACEERASVVVIEGLPSVFCTGADLRSVGGEPPAHGAETAGPEMLYDVWTRLAMGSYVSVAHVRGKVTAGGVGFVAASDVVIAEDAAEFALSELLFGLLPACVLPFLSRRIGDQKASYMTLMTKPVGAERACRWGLVDVHGPDSAALLRQHLSRLRHLTKRAVGRYKHYAARLPKDLLAAKDAAVTMNREVFRDPENLARVARYVESGRLPWE